MAIIDEKWIEQLVEALTLEEKIGMIHGAGLFRTEGVERLNIPAVKMADGPMGVRSEFENAQWISIGTTDDYVTYLPSNSALAATWNKELVYKCGQVLGEEARGRGKDVILAPGINIKRSPLCGRNYEYMSEDPRLIEELVVPLIKGIQENDVAACVKHFAANGQETERLLVDTIVDERTLREIYYPGFKAAVQKANTYSIMGAYNLLNGEHCCQSKYLLGKVLRNDWGYDGTVICDWGGVHDTELAAESKLDIEMSVYSNFDEYYMAQPLLKAVKNGEIEEAHIDEKVSNILRMMIRLKMIGQEREERKTGTYNTHEHRNTVLQAARESVVLLKNEGNRLPIKTKGMKKIAVIGHNSEKIHSNGGGSSEIKALYEISPLMGLKTKLGGNVEVKYAKGYYIPDKQNSKEVNWQESSLEENDARIKEDHKAPNVEQRHDVIGRKLLEEAVALAKECEEVIFFGGLNHEYDVEGLDREDMKLPYKQEELIQAILEVNTNTVIVIVAGSPIEMNTWIGKAKAVVWGWYAGMEGGCALAEVLLGSVNPSGKLPETFPKSALDSYPSQLNEFAKKDKVIYKDSIYVGYRYYDTFKIESEFCFGHGLSYTTFQYESMTIQIDEKAEDVFVTIGVKVKNSGGCFGAETVQVYVNDIQSSVDRPLQELKGFAKVFLEVGEQKSVTIELTKDSFGFWSDVKQCFIVEPGAFNIRIGSSSKDIRLEKEIYIGNTLEYK